MNKNYFKIGYITKDRWNNYWYQINGIRKFKDIKSILEIGPGNKIVNELLKKLDFFVESLDVDENVSPDYIASAEKIPLNNKSYDLVLAAEVIEHLPFDKFETVLMEIRRVAKRGVVISLPHSGYTASFSFKIPLVKWKHFIFKIPHFWRTKTSTPEHFWELGLRKYSVGKIKKIIKKTGFKISDTFIRHDDPAHMFFILEIL